jgi:hypothetical protein
VPFKSKEQRRFLFAKHPHIAKRWAEHTPDIKGLPEKKMKKTSAEIVELVLKYATDGKGNPFNTITTTRPSERSSLQTQNTVRASTTSSLPETKPISDGTEDGAFGGVVKVSLAQKVAEQLLERAAHGHS